MSNKCVRREPSSSSDLNHAITPIELRITEQNRAGCKLNIFELGAVLKCSLTDSFEFFVADDAFERGASAKRHPVDDFELIGKGDAFEGGAVLECSLADSLEIFVADDALEESAFEER